MGASTKSLSLNLVSPFFSLQGSKEEKKNPLLLNPVISFREKDRGEGGLDLGKVTLYIISQNSGHTLNRTESAGGEHIGFYESIEEFSKFVSQPLSAHTTPSSLPSPLPSQPFSVLAFSPPLDQVRASFY